MKTTARILKSYVAPVLNGTECPLLSPPFNGTKGSHKRYKILTESGPIWLRFALHIFTSFETFLRFTCNIALGQNILLYMRVPSSHGNRLHCWIYFLSWKAD